MKTNKCKIHAIKFHFSNVLIQEYENHKSKHGDDEKSKKLAEDIKKKRWALLTRNNEEFVIDEKKVYKVMILKAFVQNGVEYCTIQFENTDKICDWVAYKDFKFM